MRTWKRESSPNSARSSKIEWTPAPDGTAYPTLHHVTRLSATQGIKLRIVSFFFYVLSYNSGILG